MLILLQILHKYPLFCYRLWCKIPLVYDNIYGKMYKRNINQKLKEWLRKPSRKPLILRGARQVGKTTIIEDLGMHYDQFLSLNLELKADRDLFEQDYAINDLIAAIHFHQNKPIDSEGETLIFIDEIQNSPKAAAILRYFYEVRNDIHVIAAGSLLETLVDRHISFPVGRVEYLFMYPMSFSEYLLAANKAEALKFLQQYPCPEFAHNKLIELFHQYTLVGGMPEAITAFLADNDIVACNAVYQNLMTAFMDDVEKYASSRNMVQVIRHAIEHSPIESGARIKFQGFGSSNYKSREMGEALRTLEKAMLIKLVYPTTLTTPPGKLNHKKSPKLQFLDTGIVNYIAGLQQHYFTLKDLNTLYMGRIIENIVGQELLATYTDIHQQLKFWVREKAQSSAEVDYVVPFGKYLVPVEVKSGKTGTLKSLMQYIDATDHDYAVRFYAGNIQTDQLKTQAGKEFQLLNLPYYLVGELEQYLQKFITQ